MTSHPLRRGRAFLTVTAALILAAFLAGCGGGSGASGKTPAAASTRSPTDLRTMPAWDVKDEGAQTPIEPGTYLVPSSSWSLTDFTVTFPEGWTVQYGHVYEKNGDSPDEFGFYAVVVDEIYSDSCAPENEGTRPVGPGVDDLYVALRHQGGGAAIGKPARTTLGGYPAIRIDLEIPELPAECRMAPTGLQIWYSEPADKHFVLLADATASVYVVDVDGKRQVFLVQVGRSASTADRAELQTVLDSIRIAPAS